MRDQRGVNKFATPVSQFEMTFFLTFALMPVLVFLGLTVQRWLFRNSAEKIDPEWELYQQRYD